MGWIALSRDVRAIFHRQRRIKQDFDSDTRFLRALPLLQSINMPSQLMEVY